MNAIPGDYQPRALPPLVVKDETKFAWQDRADIVVVGLGGAGVCAALEALESGADVIAVDRYAGGGATSISGGVCYAGGGTRYQREAGVEDTPEEMFRYLQKETQGIIKDSTLKTFCENSSANLDWLAGHGVQYGGNLYPTKTSYPPEKYTLYYSGNETVAEYAEVAKPAPRGHRVAGHGLTGGNFFAPLKQSVMAKGLKFHPFCEAKRFVVDGQGEILGIEVSRIASPALQAKINRYNRRYISNFARLYRGYARRILKKVDQLWDRHGESVYIRANKAVIISSGGYINNRGMVGRYAPGYLGAMPLGNIGCTGGGIELAQTLGGAVDKMGNVSALRAINPPVAFLQGVVVNGEGRRFTAEDSYQDRLGRHIVQDGGGKAYIIIDKTLYRQAFKEAMPGPGKIFLMQCAPALMSLSLTVKKGATLEKLAEKCGMDPEALSETIRVNNEVALKKAEDPFKKASAYHFKMDTPPFYAVNISIDSLTFPCPALSLGGLKVDEETGQVISQAGQPIKKLYAAGRSAVGVPSNGYMSGFAIADCVFSGRRAARHALIDM